MKVGSEKGIRLSLSFNVRMKTIWSQFFRVHIQTAPEKVHIFPAVYLNWNWFYCNLHMVLFNWSPNIYKKWNWTEDNLQIFCHTPRKIVDASKIRVVQLGLQNGCLIIKSITTQVPAHHTQVIWAKKLLEFLAVDSHHCRCHHLYCRDIWGWHDSTGMVLLLLK